MLKPVSYRWTRTGIQIRKCVGRKLFLPRSPRKMKKKTSSPPGQRQSASARTLGSYAQCSALGASLRGARPQKQQLVSAFARVSARNKNKFSALSTVSICKSSQLKM